VSLSTVWVSLQHYGKQVQVRYETYRINRQRLWDHAVHFARWQHPAMKRRTTCAVLCATWFASVDIVSSQLVYYNQYFVVKATRRASTDHTRRCAGNECPRMRRCWSGRRLRWRHYTCFRVDKDCWRHLAALCNITNISSRINIIIIITRSQWAGGIGIPDCGTRGPIKVKVR